MKGPHINKLTQTNIQYKRWKWKQANSEPEIELPFKGSKSTMAATTMGIKTTTTATTAAKRTSEQSSRQAAGVWSSSTHASEREVGWTSTWLYMCASVCAAFQSLLCLSLSLICVCLSVICLTLHPLNFVFFLIYLLISLLASLPYPSRCLPVCLSASQQQGWGLGRKERAGGGWVRWGIR